MAESSLLSGEVKEKIKELVATSIVYLIHTSRGKYISFTSRRIRKLIEAEVDAPIMAVSHVVTRMLDRLYNYGVIDAVETKDYRKKYVKRWYFIFNDNELWSLAKSNPNLAVKFLVDVLGDAHAHNN